MRRLYLESRSHLRGACINNACNKGTMKEATPELYSRMNTYLMSPKQLHKRKHVNGSTLLRCCSPAAPPSIFHSSSPSQSTATTAQYAINRWFLVLFSLETLIVLCFMHHILAPCPQPSSFGGDSKSTRLLHFQLGGGHGEVSTSSIEVRLKTDMFFRSKLPNIGTRPYCVLCKVRLNMTTFESFKQIIRRWFHWILNLNLVPNGMLMLPSQILQLLDWPRQERHSCGIF